AQPQQTHITHNPARSLPVDKEAVWCSPKLFGRPTRAVGRELLGYIWDVLPQSLIIDRVSLIVRGRASQVEHVADDRDGIVAAQHEHHLPLLVDGEIQCSEAFFAISSSMVSRDGLPLIHPNAAALDIGADQIVVAVPPDRDPTPVRVFRTFTPDLAELVAWLIACRIDTVALESTGVYWIPIYELLEQHGILP